MNELSCQNLRSEVQEIKTLKEQFDAALEESIRTGETAGVSAIKQMLEERAKSLSEKLWPFETLSREQVRAQYETQQSALNKAGVLTTLSNGELGIKDIAGIERPMPKLETIIGLLGEKREVLSRKIDQGFTRILVVPVGIKLDDLIEGYRKTLIKHQAEGNLVDAKGTQLDLDENTPFWVWDKYNGADINGSIVYDPQEFSADHQGKSKAALLTETENTAFPGWKVILVEDLIEVVAENQGETKAARPPLQANKTPSQYLEMLGNEKPYTDEEGIYPEDFIALALAQLETSSQVLDADMATYCTGAYFPTAWRVPVGFWFRGARRASLGRCGPGGRLERVGARSAVRVT